MPVALLANMLSIRTHCILCVSSVPPIRQHVVQVLTGTQERHVEYSSASLKFTHFSADVITAVLIARCQKPKKRSRKQQDPFLTTQFRLEMPIFHLFPLWLWKYIAAGMLFRITITWQHHWFRITPANILLQYSFLKHSYLLILRNRYEES